MASSFQRVRLIGGRTVLQLGRGTPGAAIGLLVIGTLVFAAGQTQEILRSSFFYEATFFGGTRNDGLLAAGAGLAALGCALLLGAISRLPLRRRLAPMAVVASSGLALVLLHFTLFVNSFVVPDTGLVSLRASFVFNDAFDYVPIALFIVVLATLLLLACFAGATLRLVTPRLLSSRFTRPTAVEDHRYRLVLVSLVLLAAGAAFTRTFFSYALAADATPAAGVINTNIVLVYYLITITQGLVLAAITWRTYLLVWGDLRAKRTLSFRRALLPLEQGEAWLIAFLFGLHALVLVADPVVQPEPSQTLRVFAVNSRGTSILMILLVPLYIAHRMAVRAWMARLRALTEKPERAGMDRLARLALTLAVGWTVLAFAPRAVDLEPLTALALRLAFVALVLPFWVVRFEISDVAARPVLKEPAGPLVLLFGTLLSVIVGLMLWGHGNSVTTFYSRGSGLITAESSLLQPYSTGIRLLGSLFLATPLTFALWLTSTRRHPSRHPGPILVAGLSTVIALNMLFTINAESPTDSALGQTEVLVGYYIVSLSTVADKVIVLGLWALVAGVGLLATRLLLERSSEPPATRGLVAPQAVRPT